MNIPDYRTAGTIIIDKELKDKLKSEAKKDKRSYNAFVEIALAKAVKYKG